MFFCLLCKAFSGVRFTDSAGFFIDLVSLESGVAIRIP